MCYNTFVALLGCQCGCNSFDDQLGASRFSATSCNYTGQKLLIPVVVLLLEIRCIRHRTSWYQMYGIEHDTAM